VLLPAGVIDAYDLEDTCVYVQRTKEEIKNAPEFDPGKASDRTYREQYGSYYGPGGLGYYEGVRPYSRPIGTRSR
jgi:hypothetical protein